VNSTRPPTPIEELYSWHGWCKRLPKVPRRTAAKSGLPFDFFAVLRNPFRPGRASLGFREGLHGIRDPKVLVDYTETLRAAWEFFISDQGRTAPEQRLAVYIFAVDDDEFGCGVPCFDELPFFKANGEPDRVVPMIALPSRSREPEVGIAASKVRSEIVHELSHFFNSRFLPYRRINGATKMHDPWAGSWLWLDEGMAVASESDFSVAESVKAAGLRIGKDWLRYGLDWVDHPERSLDAPGAEYQAAFFVRYVNRLLSGPGFLNEVWKKSASVWEPEVKNCWAAITALQEELNDLPNPKVFCSAIDHDLFASGYCFDSYFLNSEGSPGFEPEVFGRFSGRAVTQTWRMENRFDWPNGQSESYSLPGLACRYFRFLPAKKPGRLKVRVSAPAGHRLKAELAFAVGNPEALSPGTRSVRMDGSLECEVPGFSAQACHHAVLVVTNCAIGESPTPHQPPGGYRSSVDFMVKADLV